MLQHWITFNTNSERIADRTDFDWCNTQRSMRSVRHPFIGTRRGATALASIPLPPAGGIHPETPWNESCANPRLPLGWGRDIANYVYGTSASQIANTEQTSTCLDYSFNYYQGTRGLGVTDPSSRVLVQTGSAEAAARAVASSMVPVDTSSSLGSSFPVSASTRHCEAPIPSGGAGSLGPYTL